MAPTEVLPVRVTVQVGEFSSVKPAAGTQPIPGSPSPDDHPPNPAPVGDAVNVTVEPVSYVPVQTEPLDEPGPQ